MKSFLTSLMRLECSEARGCQQKRAPRARAVPPSDLRLPSGPLETSKAICHITDILRNPPACAGTLAPFSENCVVRSPLRCPPDLTPPAARRLGRNLQSMRLLALRRSCPNRRTGADVSLAKDDALHASLLPRFPAPAHSTNFIAPV